MTQIARRSLLTGNTKWERTLGGKQTWFHHLAPAEVEITDHSAGISLSISAAVLTDSISSLCLPVSDFLSRLSAGVDLNQVSEAINHQYICYKCIYIYVYISLLDTTYVTCCEIAIKSTQSTNTRLGFLGGHSVQF